MIGREDAFTIGIFHLLQLACYKGEQVGAEWFGRAEVDEFSSVQTLFGCDGSIRYGLPFGRHFELEGELRFQVRLLEAREDGTGTVGYQQGIEKFLVAVERLVTGAETDMYFVLSFFKRYLWQDDMFVAECILRGFSIDEDILNLVSTFTEVEDDLLRVLQKETDTGFPFHGLLFPFRDGEVEVIL